LTGGGVGSGLGGSSLKLFKGERGGSGLKKPEGDIGGKLGSMGVVNAEEEWEGLYKDEPDCDTVAVLAVLVRKDREEPLANERLSPVIMTIKIWQAAALTVHVGILC